METESALAVYSYSARLYHHHHHHQQQQQQRF